MKKLTAFILAMLLACGSIAGCEKDTPGEETTKNPSETVAPKPVETKAPEVPPVEGEIINLADEGILISSNGDANVADAFDLDISTAVRLDATNSDNWIGIELPQPAILCYASFSAQDTDYDGTTNSPWDIYGHIIEGSNDGENWEFILQFGDPYDEYDDYAVEYEKGNNYATEYAFDGESEYDDDATEAKAYRFYRSWNDGKGGPLWGELELWGVLVGEPVETDAPETKAPETKAPETKPVEAEVPETKPVETAAPETKPVETAVPETKPVETAAPETKPVETEVPETKPVETAAPETKPVETKAPETKPVETEVPETKLVPQGISVQGQKYPYEDKDILILDVENTTDTDYTATLTVTFYNEAGKKIRTQKKMIKELPAENKQFHLFQPNQKFASYTYEVTVEEYTDTVHLSTLSGGEYSAEVRRRANIPTSGGQRATVFSIPTHIKFGPYTSLPEGMILDVQWDLVVFDNTGKIYTIARKYQTYLNNDTILTHGDDVLILENTEDPNMPMPEELKGEVSVIMCLVGYEVHERR